MTEVLLNEPENPAPYHNKLLEILERIKNRKVKLYYVYHERSSPRRKYRIQTTSKDISLNLTQFEPHEVDDLVEFLECKQAEHRGEDFLLVYTHEGKAVKSIIVSTKLIDRNPDYMAFTLR